MFDQKDYSKRYQLDHLEAWTRYNQKSREKVKLLVLTSYSLTSPPSCARCSISDTDVLTIDHIDNGGAEHRRELGYSGNGFYGWLKKHNCPEGYQVLCFNCNHKKEVERLHNGRR